ncbi:uncharacterized protein LOC135193316 [Vanessa tameamea]|uniref:Uncharacterized protein LOC135193316 n=1 Tax=Vanessa tameamea TaxID=334116 RepID=A0ABM4AIT9_VANTA
MSAAVSTHLNTENRDCSTAPSLHLSNLEDVSMGTDNPEINRSEKSTSYAQFTDYINAGLSTSNLVKQISFNDGPHYTQDSFGAGVCPECSSICINTDVETKQMSIETGSSLEFKHGISKIDGYSQYSTRSSNRSNQLLNSSGHSAHIGHSRLLSVRNLGESLYVPPQQTVCSSLDKKVKITQQRSVLASQTTSIDASSIQQPSNNIQANPDTGNIADHSKPSCNDPKSMIESNSNRITPNSEPNAVTSNLNAAKWIKGYVNDSKKDTTSAKPLEVVSTISVTEIRPTKENTQSNEKPIASNKPSDSRKFVVDQIISGQVFPSDVTESVQVRPDVQDAATGSIAIKICHSNFAGSSHILPKLLSYCDGNINTDNEVTELLKKMTSRMTSCMLSANAECCPGCNRPVTTDISIQAVVEYLSCPKCTSRIADTLLNDKDTIDDPKWRVTTDSRYFSNLLAMKIVLFKDYFQRCLAPPVNVAVYHRPTTPNIYIEACTMKPSGRQDEYCQTKISSIYTKKRNRRSCYISPAYSLIDIRENQEKEELKAVYNILTAIEGRVRRLKNHLHT